jgi:hypothetical protein
MDKPTFGGPPQPQRTQFPSVVKALTIKTTPTITVKSSLDSAGVLEMLGLEGTTVVGRLQSLQEAVKVLRSSREQYTGTLAQLKTLMPGSPEHAEALRGVQHYQTEIQRWQDEAARLLLVMSLEANRIIG